MAKILNAVEVAEKLGITAVTCRKYLANGMLPGKKVGKSWFVVETDLEAFLSGVDRKNESAGGHE
jgi:excisionase family DNA binding protein